MGEQKVYSILSLSPMWEFFSEAQRVEAVNYFCKSLEQSKKSKEK